MKIVDYMIDLSNFKRTFFKKEILEIFVKLHIHICSRKILIFENGRAQSTLIAFSKVDFSKTSQNIFHNNMPTLFCFYK